MPVPAVSSARVLVVSDSLLNHMLLTSILRASKIEVTAASLDVVTGGEVPYCDFDCILCDGSEIGLRLCNELRALHLGSPGGLRARPELVVLSATGEEAPRQTLGRVGITTVPSMSAASLLKAIERALDGSRRASHPDAIWDRSPFDDLRRRLGDERMLRFLRNLAERVAEIAAQLHSCLPREAIRPKLHDLRSIAGLLGFVEMLDVCTSIQSSGAADRDDGWWALPGASARVLEAIDAYVLQGREGALPPAHARAGHADVATSRYSREPCSA